MWWKRHHLFSQVNALPDPVHRGDDDGEAWAEGPVVAAKALNHHRAGLRYHPDGSGEEDDQYDHDHSGHDQPGHQNGPAVMSGYLTASSSHQRLRSSLRPQFGGVDDCGRAVDAQHADAGARFECLAGHRHACRPHLTADLDPTVSAVDGLQNDADLTDQRIYTRRDSGRLGQVAARDGPQPEQQRDGGSGERRELGERTAPDARHDRCDERRDRRHPEDQGQRQHLTDPEDSGNHQPPEPR